MAQNICRCCGRVVWASDNAPIHTKCIPNHWTKHAKGKNARRCREFSKERETWSQINPSTI